MGRRAEQVGETRQRITQAAVRLHTTVGPAHTSISSVAEEADVTRLTVYRHFADLDALFVACMAHWNAANPGPDVAAWSRVEPLEARARVAFTELYRWYADRHEELYPIVRDWAAIPKSAQDATAAGLAQLADVILGGARIGDAPGFDDASKRIVVGVTRHLVAFWTWRSLVMEQGLTPEQAAEAAVEMLLATARRNGNGGPPV